MTRACVGLCLRVRWQQPTVHGACGGGRSRHETPQAATTVTHAGRHVLTRLARVATTVTGANLRKFGGGDALKLASDI
jgi:hypothetical protein